MAAPHELYDEAISLKDEGKPEEAVSKLKEVLAADASYALAHAALAIVYQKLSKHAEAVEHAKKVCEIQPNDPFSYTALSVTCQRAFAGTGDTSFIQAAEDAMAKSHAMGQP